MEMEKWGNGEMEKEEKIIPLQRDFIRDVKKLEVFKRAYTVSLSVHKQTLLFPKIEQYALADQMRRASKSICANLAEGFARQSYSKPEFKRFISIAHGSANEMQLWISYAFDLEYIENALFQEWLKEYDAIIGMLVNLRNKIK